MTSRLADASPLIGGLALALAGLLCNHPAPLLVLVAATLPLAPRPRWPLLTLAFMGLVMNGAFSWYGSTVLWRAPFTLALVGRPQITLEALALGGTTGLQIALVAVGATLALARTAPQALGRILPGRGPRLAFQVALRQLPDFARDARGVKQALAVRGVETAGLRGGVQLLPPLVSRSLDRTMTNVEVLHARGGGARPRTALRLAAVPLLASGIAVALLAGLFFAGWWPQASYFPRVALSSWRDPATWSPLLALAALPWRTLRD